MQDFAFCPGALWARKLPALRRLPAGDLRREDLLRPEFLLAQEGRLSVYWIPFEWLNPIARVFIAGLTPGYGQMERAFTAARDGLRLGLSTPKVLAQVGQSAAFAGSMRTNMIRMLDSVGLAHALGIGSSAELFAEHRDLVHATSALRYPVLVDGENYGGTNPAVHRSELLTSYLLDLFASELLAVPDALVVPLGRAVEQCVRLLVSIGVVDEWRCLFGFPHPSGVNAQRAQQFDANKTRMKKEIDAWSGTL